MAVQGSLVAVVDPTGFSAQDEMLTDLTRVIAGAIDGRLAIARWGDLPASAPFGYGPAPAIEGETAAGHNAGFWAAGIGSYRNQDADGVDVGFDTTLGGLLIGYDAQVSAGTGSAASWRVRI